MANKISFFLSFLAILAALQLSAAVEYTITNKAAATPGGVKFNNEIGAEYTTKTLSSATSFTWSIFQQNTDADRKNVALTGFDGVLYHEMAHVWQWFGNGQAKAELIEGIADYVRLKAGYIPSHWVQPGQGDRWDQGYDVTARFLEYCNGLRDGFVAELNKKMRDGYNDGYFVDLLGKTVDQLWAEYKA
ncbi:unnamed protein product [Lactuca saligna]|uniref:Plant basic secretory protein (BSP) family protein n=1 Tax=Lactuca saligna TaxID=75948 RepID=A0AA36A4Y4_LACSI|nr:unnamed protein product [Lactuca saligna]